MNIARLTLFSLLTLVVTSCASYYHGMDDGLGGKLGVPEITKSGNPEILYSLTEPQVKDLFPHGMSRDLVHQKYGKPILTSNTTHSNGNVFYVDTFRYSRSSHTFTAHFVDSEALDVDRSISVVITYDKDKLINKTAYSRTQSYRHTINTNSTSRDATDAEIEKYLGPTQPITPIAISGQQKLTTTQSQNLTESVSTESWTLGLRVSDTPVGAKIKGLVVDEVVDGSLAEKVGIKVADIITKINDKPIDSRDDFVSKLQNTKTSSPLKLRVVTKGKGRNVVIEPIQKSADV